MLRAAALGWTDLTVLLVSLLVVVAIGVRSGRRHAARDLDGYLLGGRSLPWWALLGSIVATETSTATVLSVPGVAFGPAGMTFLQLAFGYVLGRIVVARVLLPLYFRGRVSSAYQLLEARFGTSARRSAALLFLVARNLGDGLRLFLAAIVLEQLAGWPFGASVVVMGVATMVYTVIGGMRSVVWSDCLQLAIYTIGGVISVFVIGAAIPGGWDGLWEFAAATDKLRVLDWRLSWSEPYTFWAGLIGGAVLTAGTHGADQMIVQRHLSARSRRDAACALVTSGFVVVAQFGLFLFIGVQLAAYYASRPEIAFDRTDQVFAHFIVNVFPVNTGLVGLMLAAILAAAMSTLSSSLNSSASAVVNDFYLTGHRKRSDPTRALAFTRALTVVFACVQMGIGYLAWHLSSAVVDNALTIAGFSAGLLLGLFALAILTRSVGQRAALVGAGSGLAVLLVVQFGLPAIGEPRLAYPWLALVGSTAVFTAGLVAQWVAGNDQPRKPGGPVPIQVSAARNG